MLALKKKLEMYISITLGNSLECLLRRLIKYNYSRKVNICWMNDYRTFLDNTEVTKIGIIIRIGSNTT